jgi:hypothetical protein
LHLVIDSARRSALDDIVAQQALAWPMVAHQRKRGIEFFSNKPSSSSSTGRYNIDDDAAILQSEWLKSCL